jgi:hypothetical protein
MTKLMTLASALLIAAVTAVSGQDAPTQPQTTAKHPPTAREVLATICAAPSNEPACQRRASLTEDEAWLIVRAACRQNDSASCQAFRQGQGGVLFLDARTRTWRSEWESESWPLKFNVAGTPTLRLKPRSANDLKIVVEGVSPLIYSATPGTPTEADLEIIANLKTFLSVAATGIQAVIQTAAFSAAPGPTRADSPDSSSGKSIAASGGASRAPSAKPAEPPPPPCRQAPPQAGVLTRVILDRNAKLLQLNQAVAALSKELAAVETTRRAFVTQAQKAADGGDVEVSSLKAVDVASLNASFAKMQDAVSVLESESTKLTSCQPLLSAYALLLSAPADPDVVNALAAHVETLAKTTDGTPGAPVCQVPDVAAALKIEAGSASCAADPKVDNAGPWLKRHLAAMKPLADRLFDPEASETAVWDAIDAVQKAKPPIIASIDTLRRQVDQALVHSWNGRLIPEIVVTRQNPELPWSKIQTHSIVVKPVSPYAKELTLKQTSDETHTFKLESATGQILGYGVGVIYTPLYESTWTAATAPDGTMVIAETKRETRAGDLAAFLSYRFLEHQPRAKRRLAQPTLDVGVGLTSGRPAFFLGGGLEVVRALRLGFGWTLQRVSTLAPDQTVGVTKVSSTDDIRTVNRFDAKHWYVSMSFALDALSLFGKS